MTAGGKVSPVVGVLSALSGWSLVAFGVLSLLVVCFSWTWPGGLIGSALLVHGLLELRWRACFILEGELSSGRRLAWNQLALAASVLLYLSWQVLSFDRTEMDAMFGRDPLRSMLELMPPDAVDLLNRDFPELLAGAYGAAGLLALLGCLGMALMYLKSGRRQAA